MEILARSVVFQVILKVKHIFPLVSLAKHRIDDIESKVQSLTSTPQTTTCDKNIMALKQLKTFF